MRSQSQSELNEQATRSVEKADLKLNKIYKEVVAKYSANQIFTSKLRTSEAAWIGYRDAHLKSIFPADKPFDEYGSAYTLCYQVELLAQTNKRSEQLAAISNACKIDLATAESQFKAEELQLNTTYEQASTKIAPKYLRYLREAESEWRAFRDAESDALATLGSSKNREVIRLNSRTSLDTARVKELNSWVTGFEEGNVCCGSRPVR